MALTQITTDGIKDGTITGTDLATNIDLVDNQKLRLGTGNDLQFYHDGSNSFIQDVGTGNLYIQSTSAGVYIQKVGGEDMAKFITDGSVELYENGTKVAETTAGGWNVEGVTYSNGLDMDDNHKILLGIGDDLEIYHDGTDDRIKSGSTNSMIIASKYLRLMNQAANETMAKFTENGAVELNFDNSKKFETTSSGIDVTGEIQTTGHIRVPDNMALIAGTGSDLFIYHDGSNTFIDSTLAGGQVLIRTKESGGTTNNAAKFMPTGAVELFYDGAKKFETTSIGATVSGRLDTQGLFTGDNHKILVGNSDDLQIYHDGTDSIIDSGTGNLKIIAPNDVEAIKVFNDGTVNIGANADNVKLRFGIGSDLQIYHDGNNSFIDNTGTGDLNLYGDDINILNKAKTEFKAKFITNGAVELFYDNDHRLTTQNAGVDLRRSGTITVNLADVADGQSNNHVVSTLTGLGKDSGNNFTSYSTISTQIVDNTNGSEDSRLSFQSMRDGSLITAATVERGYFQRNTAPGFAGESFQWVNTYPNMHNGSIKWTSGHFVNSTGIFTCPVAGKYLCMATVQSHRANTLTGASSQYFNVLFQKNNVNYFGETVGTQHANGGSSTGIPDNHFQVTQAVIVDAAANETIRAHSNHGYRYGVQNQLSIILIA